MITEVGTPNQTIQPDEVESFLEWLENTDDLKCEAIHVTRRPGHPDISSGPCERVASYRAYNDTHVEPRWFHGVNVCAAFTTQVVRPESWRFIKI